MRKTKNGSFEKLVGVMRRLLGPGGCPWDREQTHRSLLKYFYEEAGEVAGAVRRGDWKNLEEELGDLLLQVVFHAELARRAGRFDIHDVTRGIASKLIRRHPHVFGNAKAATPEEVLKQWKIIKAKEGERRLGKAGKSEGSKSKQGKQLKQRR